MRNISMRRHAAGFRSRSRQLLAGLFSATLALPCLAQDTARSGPLHDELAGMDAALFEAAFVTCDAGKFRALFTADAEFYHDKAGASFGEAVKVMKSCPRDNGVTRTLVPGSLEVYPMQGYGAVQIGRHVLPAKAKPARRGRSSCTCGSARLGAGGWRGCSASTIGRRCLRRLSCSRRGAELRSTTCT